MNLLSGRGSPPTGGGTTRGSPLGAGGPAGSTPATGGSSTSPGGTTTNTTSTGGLFNAYHSATSLQHHSTHLAYASSPSLTGELLRQSLSEFLRTQVAHVHQVVVLYGFNAHDYQPDEDIPITEGKLCYAAITQCECVLIDRAAIAKVRTGERHDDRRAVSDGNNLFGYKISIADVALDMHNCVSI